LASVLQVPARVHLATTSAVSPSTPQGFIAAHREQNGYAAGDGPIELVNLRLVARVVIPRSDDAVS
jgi:hypothetical protein